SAVAVQIVSFEYNALLASFSFENLINPYIGLPYGQFLGGEYVDFSEV
ncbi:MAG: hypothetical protein EZS28_043935, partial [Streblomastix strix]